MSATGFFFFVFDVLFALVSHSSPPSLPVTIPWWCHFAMDKMRVRSRGDWMTHFQGSGFNIFLWLTDSLTTKLDTARGNKSRAFTVHTAVDP
ncbi:hypothetical protein V8F06_009932 [Rhypophila decipiens]